MHAAGFQLLLERNAAAELRDVKRDAISILLAYLPNAREIVKGKLVECKIQNDEFRMNAGEVCRAAGLNSAF